MRVPKANLVSRQLICMIVEVCGVRSHQNNSSETSAVVEELAQRPNGIALPPLVRCKDVSSCHQSAKAVAYIDDISARLRTIIRKPKKLQMTIQSAKSLQMLDHGSGVLTHDDGSSSSGCCNGKSAVSGSMSIGFNI